MHFMVPNILYRTHNSHCSSHSQINPVHLLHFKSLFVIHFNITFYTKVFEEFVFLEISPPKSCVHFSYPRTFRKPLSLISWRDTNHETSCYAVSPFFSYVLPLQSKCLIQHHILKHPRPLLLFVPCIL